MVEEGEEGNGEREGEQLITQVEAVSVAVTTQDRRMVRKGTKRGFIVVV